MGTLGDLWQIRAVGELYGQEINNIFWYEQISAGASTDASQAAYGMFFNKLSPAICPIQHEDFVWTEVVATNWTTGLEQDVHPILTGGEGQYITGDCSPSFVAWAFRYQKSVPVYSSGSKRFAGVPEELVDGNATVAYGTAYTTAETSLETNLSYGVFAARPVVLVTAVGGVPQNTAMANPPYTFWQANNVQFRGATTQRTRKP